MLSTLLTNASELGAVPPGWEILVSPGGGGMLPKQIYYRNVQTRKIILDHPKLGPLPIPWVIRFCSSADGNQVVRYVNPKTMQSTRRDPRWASKILQDKNSKLKHSNHMIASYAHKMTESDDMSTMHREEIGNKNTRSQWAFLK